MRHAPPLTIVRAECEMFRRAFDYRGRSTRTAFWKALPGCIMMSVVWLFLLGIPSGMIAEFFNLGIEFLPYVYHILALGLLVIYVPFVALGVRRLRDAGLSPWLMLLLAGCLLPACWVPSLLVLGVLMAQPSRKV